MPSLFEEEAKRMAALNKHKNMKNDNPLPTIGVILAAIVGILALLVGGWVYGVFAYGFVIAKIWGWFMVAKPFSLSPLLRGYRRQLCSWWCASLPVAIL